MLPPLLFRASAVSSGVSPFSKPYTYRQNLLPFSSSSFSKKMMAGDGAPDRYPGRRGSRYGHGPVSTGKPLYREDRSSKSSNNDYQTKSLQSIRSQQRQTSPERVTGSNNVRGPGRESVVCPFDICRTESGGPVKLNKSLLEINREKRKELEQYKPVSQHKYLRSGMVLLKNYIGHQEQVRIIESCRELGMGSGGFYRPGYRDGAKLHLQMMCLGKNWDPESRLYESRRRTDGATPPKITEELRKLVDGAIQAAYDFLKQNNGGTCVEVELPRMSPDICIVNFYSSNGKLGLHQDRDESKDSLHKGLPVVSFSLGDAAEFLYGEGRDVDMAENVLLESGDVLIFGGKSRHLFHGVSSILPDTAPKRLIDETKLKPGRLNLTFRQY